MKFISSRNFPFRLTTFRVSNEDPIAVAARYVGDKKGFECERVVEMKEFCDEDGDKTAKMHSEHLQRIRSN